MFEISFESLAAKRVLGILQYIPLWKSERIIIIIIIIIIKIIINIVFFLLFFFFCLRFTPENQCNVNQYAYLPFGNGPRNCIGQRLALLEVKMTLIALLQKYKIVKSSKLEVSKIYQPAQRVRPTKPINLFISVIRRSIVVHMKNLVIFHHENIPIQFWPH